ncbi:MAG: hypothetical protein IAE78_07590 [Myxococcus sp.]|nr:hypothetical protein [Myxococcus sp.]
MPTQAFEVTGVYLAGFRKALVELGLLEPVLQRVSPATKAALDSPHSARTHDADLLRDASDALFAVAGSQVFQKHAYLMARDTLGKILVPMFKVALALTGTSPATLLARVPDSVHQALRGVTVTWTPESPNAGALQIDYPVAVPPVAEDGWRGTLKFLFELTERTPAAITWTAWRNDRRTLVMRIAW